MQKIFFCFFILIAFANCNNPNKNKVSFNNNNSELTHKIVEIIKPYNAKIGVAIITLEDRDTILVNNENEYPMQSVFKFPLALAVLAKIDKGELTLDRKIHISKEELQPNTWSPLRDSFPNGNADVTIAELLRYSVSISDNNACDILFKVINGPKALDKYVHDAGIKDIAITTNENAMHQSWFIQYNNWSTPLAMTELIDLFYHKKLLSDSTNNFLMKLMTESTNSAKRLKGLLPEGTIVAHKTGTSDVNNKGLRAATNDTGIITLPNGKHFAITVYVSNTMETTEVNEKIIAEICKAAFDYFNATKK